MSPDFPQEIREEQRNEAVRLAEERGRREQLVDSRLADHDRQFLALNGSIDRLARNQEQAVKELGKTTEKLGEVATQVKISKEVSEAVAKNALNSRQLWTAVGVVMVPIAVALIGVFIK